MEPVFGQLVVGPPGAGKTTFCQGMAQFLRTVGRDCAVVNLDPANDLMQPPADVDVMELVSLPRVMAELNLGPNGGLIYCLEFLEANLDWLLAKLAPLRAQRKYLLFDFPGQVELFTHCPSVASVVRELVQADCRLTCVNLIDAHHCSDASKFIAASLLSLTVMIRLELPHVNVLSKVDLIESYGELPFNLEFFTDMQDLPRLLPYLDSEPALEHTSPDDPPTAGAAGADADGMEVEPPSPPSPPGSGVGEDGHRRFVAQRRKLHEAMCELVEDFGLVSFETCNIEDAESVARVLKRIDASNGYVFGSAEAPMPPPATGNSGVGTTAGAVPGTHRPDYVSHQRAEFHADRTLLVQERYMGTHQPFAPPGVPAVRGGPAAGPPGPSVAAQGPFAPPGVPGGPGGPAGPPPRPPLAQVTTPTPLVQGLQATAAAAATAQMAQLQIRE